LNQVEVRDRFGNLLIYPLNQVEVRDRFGNLRLTGGDVVSAVGLGQGVAHFTAGADNKQRILPQPLPQSHPLPTF
jgi:hypothetical protein